jgi:hypothetical protein
MAQQRLEAYVHIHDEPWGMAAKWQTVEFHEVWIRIAIV